MEIPCYDPDTLIPQLQAQGQYAVSVATIGASKSFIMANDKGEFGVYLIVNGAMCLIAQGKDFQLLPLPPNA